jgi:dihydrolipoamide dehydrogenase
MTPQPASDASATAPLVVVGGGPGGYAAAFAAADLGLQVTLIDPAEKPGGVCLYRGCIPSKALLHVAKLVNEASEAAALGVTFAPPELDLDRIRAWRDEVIGKLTDGLAMSVQQKKITYLRGTARLTDPHTLAVATFDGQDQTLTFVDSARAVDSTGALALPDVPRRLLVVGGGYIGLELGSVYAALGSEVSVVEMMPGLLPGVDRDLVSVLKRRLDKQFAEIRLNTKVDAMKLVDDGVEVTFRDKKDETAAVVYDRVLVAIGRRPNNENLGLDKTGIELDERGFVKVDAQRRTAEPHIFAIGDLAGEPQLAHKAHAEAQVAAAAAAGHDATYEPRAIPAVVFTDPELAWCGLTETEARAQKRKVKSGKVPWRGNGRTLTLGREDGITKVLVDPENDRLLGVAMAGPGAGELIAEGVLALEMAAVGEDLHHTIHPHPTLSETVYEAAAMLRAR